MSHSYSILLQNPPIPHFESHICKCRTITAGATRSVSYLYKDPAVCLMFVGTQD